MNEFYHPFSIQRTSSLFCLVFCFFSLFFLLSKDINLISVFLKGV